MRLEPLDLRAALHPFELGFELASGAPCAGGHVEVLRPDGELAAWALIGATGRARFAAPRPAVDLWATGPGVRPRLFTGVLDGDRLVLPAAPSLELRLGDDVPLPPPPFVLVAWAYRIEPEDGEPDPLAGVDVESWSSTLTQGRTLRLGVPVPGDYEVEWYVRHTGTGIDVTIEQETLQTVHVPDAPGVAVEARLTRESVERALVEAGG